MTVKRCATNEESCDTYVVVYVTKEKTPVVTKCVGVLTELSGAVEIPNDAVWGRESNASNKRNSKSSSPTPTEITSPEPKCIRSESFDIFDRLLL